VDRIAGNLQRAFNLAVILRWPDSQSKLRLTMKKRKKKSGIHLLLKKYKNLFRTLENQNHYSGEDYRNAERMFLKHALEQRRIEMQDDLFK
jgi:fatty acid-binding protein DegV